MRQAAWLAVCTASSVSTVVHRSTLSPSVLYQWYTVSILSKGFQKTGGLAAKKEPSRWMHSLAYGRMSSCTKDGLMPPFQLLGNHSQGHSLSSILTRICVAPRKRSLTSSEIGLYRVRYCNLMSTSITQAGVTANIGRLTAFWHAEKPELNSLDMCLETSK